MTPFDHPFATLLLWVAGIALAAYLITWTWMTLLRTLCPSWAAQGARAGSRLRFRHRLARHRRHAAVALGPWCHAAGSGPVRPGPVGDRGPGLPRPTRRGNCSITIFRLSDSTVARVQRLGLSSLADVTEGRASHGRRLPDWGTVHARYIDDDSAVNAIHCIGHGADLLRAVAPGIVHTGGFHAADVVHQLVLVPATGLLMVGQKID